MSFRKFLLAAAVLALPATAQAQAVDGPYVAAAAGLNWRERSVYSTPASTFYNNIAFAIAADATPGNAAVGSVGWGFGNGLRVEGEVNTRNNDVRRAIAIVPWNIPLGSPAGTIRTSGLMANAFYDIGAKQNWPVQISLGGGVGYAWNRWRGVGGVLSPIETMRIDGNPGAFAYQGIAGLTIPMKAFPGLALTTEYRYFATLDPSVRESSDILGTQFIRARERVKNHNHSMLIGLRYSFGGAAAPVVAKY